MSYRTLPPISGTYQSATTAPPNERQWTASLKSRLRLSEPLSLYDSGVAGAVGRPQWNRIAGFALAAAISVGGWSGIALLVGYLWR
jgi:hypothetical protein